MKGGFHLAVIFSGAAADAVAPLRVARPRPLTAFAMHQDQGAVGKSFADAECVNRSHGFDPEATRPSLIGERAVDEAIGEHPLSSVDRGSNCLSDMVRARGGKQQRFSLRTPAILLTGQEQSADA